VSGSRTHLSAISHNDIPQTWNKGVGIGISFPGKRNYFRRDFSQAVKPFTIRHNILLQQCNITPSTTAVINLIILT